MRHSPAIRRGGGHGCYRLAATEHEHEQAETTEAGRRMARYVNRNPTDDWVVSAASREVPEWFAGQLAPAIAMYGRCKGIPSHTRWDYRPVVCRVVRWAWNVAQGKDDRLKRGTESKFVEGGTIGPVRGEK